MSLPNDADINQRIADRVRTLRAAQSLTLDALAERSGVSRSMISLVERGESSPTAVLLEKLSAGLGTSLASLFEALPQADAPPSPLSRHAEQTPWRDPESGYVRRNLSPPGVSHTLQLVEVAFPPGARVAYDSPPRGTPIEQQVWVLEGRIEIGVGEARWRLDAGDCLAMPMDGPNHFRNPTRKPARYLVAIAVGAHPLTKSSK